MPILFVMVGVQGSGKSSMSHEIATEYNAVHLASDSIRAELFGDEGSQEDNGKVFNLLYSRAREALTEGKNVVLDAMNISRKRRIHILSQEFRKIECERIAVYMATPLEECIKNDKARSRTVTESVIRATYKNVDIPIMAEGWNNVWYCTPTGNENDEMDKFELIRYLESCEDVNSFEKDIKKYLKSFDGLFRISHDNPHHSFSVGRHSFYTLVEARKLLGEDSGAIAVLLAATLHDVGKRYTKKFIDSKGNPSKYAHFYSHEKVSAQLALIDLLNLGFDRNTIETTIELIMFHMDLYKKPKKNGKRKVQYTISEENYKLLELLNKADKSAH